MQDPDRGGSPSGGASADLLPVKAGTAPVVAASFGPAAGADQEARNAPDNRPRGKKRRKRRRGRKVFARDGVCGRVRLAPAPRGRRSASGRARAGNPAQQDRRADCPAAPPAFRPRALGRAAGLCRARSRHQQLPAAGRRADAARPVPGRRCVLAHRPAGRRAVVERPPQPAGHGPRRRGAEDLRRQARAAGRSCARG